MYGLVVARVDLALARPVEERLGGRGGIGGALLKYGDNPVVCVVDVERHRACLAPKEQPNGLAEPNVDLFVADLYDAEFCRVARKVERPGNRRRLARVVDGVQLDLAVAWNRAGHRAGRERDLGERGPYGDVPRRRECDGVVGRIERPRPEPADVEPLAPLARDAADIAPARYRHVAVLPEGLHCCGELRAGVRVSGTLVVELRYGHLQPCAAGHACVAHQVGGGAVARQPSDRDRRAASARDRIVSALCVDGERVVYCQVRAVGCERGELRGARRLLRCPRPGRLPRVGYGLAAGPLEPREPVGARQCRNVDRGRRPRIRRLAVELDRVRRGSVSGHPGDVARAARGERQARIVGRLGGHRARVPDCDFVARRNAGRRDRHRPAAVARGLGRVPRADFVDRYDGHVPRADGADIGEERSIGSRGEGHGGPGRYAAGPFGELPAGFYVLPVRRCNVCYVGQGHGNVGHARDGGV